MMVLRGWSLGRGIRAREVKGRALTMDELIIRRGETHSAAGFVALSHL